MSSKGESKSFKMACGKESHHKKEKKTHHKKETHHKKKESWSKKPLTNKDAVRVEKLWQSSFPDAALLPKIGYPSKGHGVATLTHSLGGHPHSINGLESKSPLVNNALYSFELSGGKYINLYEVMLPDIPSKNGGLSTVQIYVNALAKYGVDVAGNHYHWTGMETNPKAVNTAAIHSQSTSVDPICFTKATIKALKKTLAVIKRRTC